MNRPATVADFPPGMPRQHARRSVLAIAAAMVQLAGAGCSGGGASEPAEASGQIVATVNGEAIHARDVLRYARTHGVGARAALRALEDDLLLRAAARDAGWLEIAETDDEAERTQERLLAQRLLLDIEERIRPGGPEGPTDQEVRAYLEEHASEIVREETRTSVNIVVQLPPVANADVVERAAVYAETQRARAMAGDFDEVAAGQPNEYEGLRISVRQLPNATPASHVPPGFREAIFGLDAPGVAREVVRSPNAFHVIYLRSIAPAIEPESDAARIAARDALILERRSSAVVALLERLRARSGAQVREQGFERVFLSASGDEPTAPAAPPPPAGDPT